MTLAECLRSASAGFQFRCFRGNLFSELGNNPPRGGLPRIYFKFRHRGFQRDHDRSVYSLKQPLGEWAHELPLLTYAPRWKIV